jgi:hypothetical protein
MTIITTVQWVDTEKNIIFETYMDDEEFERVFDRRPYYRVAGRGIILDHIPVVIDWDGFYGSEIVCKATEEVCLDET